MTDRSSSSTGIETSGPSRLRRTNTETTAPRSPGTSWAIGKTPKNASTIPTCARGTPCRRTGPMSCLHSWGKITRNVSLNRYKQNTAGKRGGGEVPAVLEEIAELVSDTDSVEQEVDRRELVKAIDAFLDRLSTEKRSLFLCRYWYFDSVSNLASRFGMTENHVSVMLNRPRRKLHNDLLERGFDL